MSVNIFDVDKKSVCYKKGIRAGNKLISVNGNEINDCLDYNFYTDDEKLNIQYSDADGRIKSCSVKTHGSADALGLEFETYLMDRHRSCKNKCIFCFIDQMPKGMRESLYFKDDDSRLSFLFGNYITLTNLTEHETERIIKMHISPINASVHTMNSDLRVKMMRNPHAGESLQLLKRFSDAGISINAQLVLCPGINDGKELEYSLAELKKLDCINSIAAVPVGLTKFRDGLFEINPYDNVSASAVIDVIDEFNNGLLSDGRNRLAFASDEFYQLAGRDVPEYDYYGDFPQLDNGVGLIASVRHDFTDALENAPADNRKRCFSVATGAAAYPLMSELAEKFLKKYPFSEIKVYNITNHFFGEKVTVAGLLTYEDIVSTLKSEKFSSPVLLLPSVTVKSDTEHIFLDDRSITDLCRELNTEVRLTGKDGYDLFDAFLE